MKYHPIVFVVDDDEAVRDSLSLMLSTHGFQCRTFPDAESFLEAWRSEMQGVLLLDLKMPGLNGLQLQDRLTERDANLPIVFITGHGTVPDAVQAMKQGAMHFLEKPYNETTLVRAIREALDRGLQEEERLETTKEIRTRLTTLTPREREVLDRLLDGDTSKQIAETLGISSRTVEVHRARIMEKLEARNAVDLTRMVTGV